MNDIEISWRDFLEKPFPEVSAGVEIEGVDLAGLDTYTAGCVETFIERKGQLDRKRIHILQNCSRELDLAVSQLDGEAKIYFEHLRNLAKQVLVAVS
jgi:hypothetical protein